MAYVAMGRLDAHWERGLQPWDSGAAALIVLEAGGRLSSWDGSPWHPWKNQLLALNGLIHDELMHVLNKELLAWLLLNKPLVGVWGRLRRLQPSPNSKSRGVWHTISKIRS